MDSKAAHDQLMQVTGGRAVCAGLDRSPWARWIGVEPNEARNAHESCECSICYPPCSAVGCWSYDVAARLIPVPSGTARVLLCVEHCGMYPADGGTTHG